MPTQLVSLAHTQGWLARPTHRGKKYPGEVQHLRDTDPRSAPGRMLYGRVVFRGKARPGRNRHTYNATDTHTPP